MQNKKRIAKAMLLPLVAVGIMGGGAFASADSYDRSLFDRSNQRSNIFDNRFHGDTFFDRDNLNRFNRYYNDDYRYNNFSNLNRIERLRGVVTHTDPDTNAVWVRLGNGQVIRVLTDNNTRYGFDGGFSTLNTGRYLDLDCDRFGNDGYRAVSVNSGINLW